MNALRVLHILEATEGGTARQLELAVRWLPREGVLPSVLLSPLRDRAQAERLCGLARELGDGAGAGLVPMRRAVRPWADLMAYRELKCFLAACRPDVIHTHAAKAGFLGRAAAHALGVPVVHTPHVLPLEWSANPLYRWLERLAGRWTDRLIALHGAQAALVRTALGLADARVVVLPNGVDTEVFRPDPGRAARGEEAHTLVVGTAARLVPHKGVGDFLRAAARLVPSHPQVEFWVAGDGPGLQALRAQAAALGLGGAVRFLGQVDDMPRFYQALDLFVLASRREGMSYAMLEAAAAGVPLVLAQTPGAAAFLGGGGAGAVFEPGDVPGLVAAVEAFLTSARKRAAAGVAAREQVLARHGVAAWARALADLYRQVKAEAPPV